MTPLSEYVPSSDIQILLKHVYASGGKMSQGDIMRDLNGKFIEEINFYSHFDHLWGNDYPSIYGIYWLNPDDPLITTLNEMMLVLKNVFMNERGKAFALESEFVAHCKSDSSLIKKVFDENYFHEFWCADDNTGDNVGHHHKTNEREYRFSNGRTVKRIMDYKDFATQIEIRWQKINTPFETRNLIDSGMGDIPDAYSAAVAAVSVTPVSARKGSSPLYGYHVKGAELRYGSQTISFKFGSANSIILQHLLIHGTETASGLIAVLPGQSDEKAASAALSKAMAALNERLEKENLELQLVRKADEYSFSHKIYPLHLLESE